MEATRLGGGLAGREWVIGGRQLVDWLKKPYPEMGRLEEEQAREKDRAQLGP